MKIKRFFSVLLAVLAAVGAFALTASADQIKDTTKDVTLTIYALETKDGSDVTVDADVTGEMLVITGKRPIKGAAFSLYRTADDETSTKTPDGEPTFKTEKTGTNGSVSITIPAAYQGRYLVVETDIPESAKKATVPFLVDLPMTDPLGEGYMYDVFAYPKQYIGDNVYNADTDVDPSDDEDFNKTNPRPVITKKVSDDKKSWGDEANIASISGNKAYWKISVYVPKGATRYDVFTVSDKLDGRLIPPEKMEIELTSENTKLDESVYKLSVSGSTITVDFKTSELYDLREKWVDIVFPTLIDTTARDALGNRIPNAADLTFTRVGMPSVDDSDRDSTDSDDDTPTEKITSETVTVWTDKLEIKKIDKDSSNPLEGAEFELFADKECRRKLGSGASGENGLLSFVGLKDGKYYIKETKAPDGYQLNNNTIELSVGSNAGVYSIENVKKSNLPVTGGAGIIGATVCGLSIALLGCIMIASALRLRRKALCVNA